MLAGAGLILLFVGYRTRKKEDKTLWYVLGVAALAGFAVTGGYITLASAPSTQGPTTVVPTGIWKVTIATVTDGDSHAAPSTIIVAPDGTHADIYLVRSTYDDANPATFNVTVNVFNQNSATQNTQPYRATLTYGTIGQVLAIASGASYPIASLLTDGKTYNVVWVAVGGAPTPTSEGLGVYSAAFTSLQNGQEKATITYNKPAFTAMTVGQQYEIDLVVAGVTLPVYFHPTS